MANKCMLTTVNNPYNPFNDFDNWYLFDITHGYNTCAYLARIANISEQFSDDENDAEVERAIDEIIKNDFLAIYVKVRAEHKTTTGLKV